MNDQNLLQFLHCKKHTAKNASVLSLYSFKNKILTNFPGSAVMPPFLCCPGQLPSLPMPKSGTGGREGRVGIIG